MYVVYVFVLYAHVCTCMDMCIVLFVCVYECVMYLNLCMRVACVSLCIGMGCVYVYDGVYVHICVSVCVYVIYACMCVYMHVCLCIHK